VKASDLRAGAALVIAGLMAKGKTLLSNSEHVDRGYENFVDKLNAVGANLEKE
jgi:UDP-N-acetylglucosamine 1-carboxyvinyltransferase